MERIPVFSPWLDESDIAAVTRALEKGWISGTSPIVQEFETAIAGISERRFVSAVANGSVALDLAFEALGLQPGDEVIVPNLTIISCLSAIVRVGATPVIVDVDPSTWNMRLEDVVTAYSNKTKAVLVVHIYGLPSPIDLIAKFCRDNELFLVEDAAEAHGQSVNGQPCGSYGDISTYSFYANKHVTTGEGGAICTNSEKFYERVTSMRNLAFGKINRFEHEEFGWNYRIGGLSAALGISQVKKLSTIISAKQKQAEHYNASLSDVSAITLPAQTGNGSQNQYWIYGVLAESRQVRSKIISALDNANIETRPFFCPLSRQPVLQKNKFRLSDDLKVSESLGERGFYLPTGSHLTPEIQEAICGVIKRVS